MKFDKPKLRFLYEAHEFKPLTNGQDVGFDELVGLIEADDKITDIRWVAYMLATVLRECGGEWKPVEEYGKGKGHPYGKPVPPFNLAYYGRGYTQNTWYDNYLMLTKAWNKAHPDRQLDFTKNPELLCVAEYAYWAMSYAMRNGTYTGVGLKKYINETKCDYVNARRIINGTDVAELIAANAVKFESILKECLL